jgi:hypothetical protein
VKEDDDGKYNVMEKNEIGKDYVEMEMIVKDNKKIKNEIKNE